MRFRRNYFAHKNVFAVRLPLVIGKPRTFRGLSRFASKAFKVLIKQLALVKINFEKSYLLSKTVSVPTLVRVRTHFNFFFPFYASTSLSVRLRFPVEREIRVSSDLIVRNGERRNATNKKRINHLSLALLSATGSVSPNQPNPKSNRTPSLNDDTVFLTLSTRGKLI